MKSRQVAVGLSGGVDSSLTAALLVEQGYDVTGVFIECWNGPGCRADEDRKDALDIALKLEIPFQVLDFKEAYHDKVVEYFFREYKAGRTPNPDTMCNREIKFGLFYDWALENDYEFVATGHYARIGRSQEVKELMGEWENEDLEFGDSLTHQLINSSNQNFLVRGIDPKKDQSYFLYQLRPEQLEHILFPIGHMTKFQVRVEAKKRKLHTAKKPDSQGICFIGKIDVNEFLKERIKEKKGDVVIQARNPKSEFRNKIKALNSNDLHISDSDLDIVSNFDIGALNLHLKVGSHQGVPFHTIGQKIGKEIDQALVAKLAKKGLLDFDPSNMPPLFVIDKDVEKNILIVGTEEETYASEFEVGEVNWLVSELESKNFDLINSSTHQPINCFVRIRHGGELINSKLEVQDSKLKIYLSRPVKGIAPGQACVFYSDDTTDAIVMGGGVIV